MNSKELQIRSIATGLHLREADDQKDSRIIEGHAVVTGAETVLYETSDYREVEVIEQSCLDEAFLKEQDIKCNLLHDRSSTIARCNKGEGNLQLESRADGLHFAFEAPNCDLGNRALELVRSRVYTGCSFEFYPKDYEVEQREGKDGKQEYVVRHKSFEALTAVTIALDPAYEQTSVNAREEYREKHPTTDYQAEAKKKAIRESVKALRAAADKILA